MSLFEFKIPPFKIFRTKEENDYIKDLPPELLVRIFSFYVDSEGYRKFLKNIPLVCKRWNDIYETPSIWKNVLDTEWKCDEVMKLGERGLLTSVRKIDNLKMIGVYYDCITLDVRQQALAIFEGKQKYPDDYFNVSRFSQMICFCPNLRELYMFPNCATKGLMQNLTEHCPKIEVLKLFVIIAKIATEPMPEDVLVPFLSLRGQNLKVLQLSNIFLHDNGLFSTIAQRCHSLEELTFDLVAFMEEDDHNVLPDQFFVRHHLTLNELMTGCPKLRKLSISRVDITLLEVGQDKSGFKNLVEFYATYVNFNGMDLFLILKNAKNLKYLGLLLCQNVLLNSISQIPSDKLEVLMISCENLDQSFMKILEKSMNKWKRTLMFLYFDRLRLDVTPILEAYLRGNPNPKLEKMILRHSDVSIPVLKTLMRTCEKLCFVVWKELIFCDRFEVEDFCLEPATVQTYRCYISRTLDRYGFQIIIVLLCILCFGCSVLYSNR